MSLNAAQQTIDLSWWKLICCGSKWFNMQGTLLVIRACVCDSGIILYMSLPHCPITLSALSLRPLLKPRLEQTNCTRSCYVCCVNVLEYGVSQSESVYWLFRFWCGVIPVCYVPLFLPTTVNIAYTNIRVVVKLQHYGQLSWNCGHLLLYRSCFSS